jgi:RHS repeat-associated protein
MPHTVPAKRLYRTSQVVTALVPFLVLFCLCALAARSSAQGGPPGGGNGNWKLEVSYTGTIDTFTQWTGSGFTGHYILNGQVLPTNATINMAGLNLGNLMTTSGGVTVGLNGDIGVAQPSGSSYGVFSASGNVVFKLTWQPKSGNSSLDPAPAKMTIFYRRRVSCGAYAGAPNAGDHGDINGEATCNVSAFAGANATGPNGEDSDPTITNQEANWTSEVLTVDASGVATTTVHFLLRSQGNGTGSQGGALLSPSIGVDFVCAGLGMARMTKVCPLVDGGIIYHGTDPTHTRWLPIAFSPVVTSQPFRQTAGAIPAPWGNLHCAYSLAVCREPANPNLDLFGGGLFYLPSPGAGGTYNAPSAPYLPKLPTAGAFVPYYSVFDSTGDRLSWNSSLVPAADVRSTFVALADGTFELRNAGPPGAIKQKGIYTYKFSTLSGTPGKAKLLSIGDDRGNLQTLTWGTGLTVTDNSSGRQMTFTPGAGGYFTAADAPGAGGLPGVHTTLTFDGGGHLTERKVFLTGGMTPVFTDTYGYGGPNGDGITSVSKGGTTTTMTYYADNLVPDPFDLAIPRISSASYGSAGDSSSSDDGGSIQGTYNWTYGVLEKGYNSWGVDARTNTVTDARGNKTSMLYELANGIWGGITNQFYTAPTFTGAPANSNKWRAYFSPSMAAPAQVSVTDQLNHVWQANLDSNGNVTQVQDPLSHLWLFGYSADGLNLTSATDPTGLQWQFAYGENGQPANRLTSIKDPGLAVRAQLTYNTYGQVITATNPVGVSATGTNEQVSLTYDNVTGDLTKVTDPLGDAVTVNSYTALGDPLSVSAYPDTGNPLTSLTPLTTAIDYNAAQAPTWVAGPSGTGLLMAYSNDVLSQFQVKNQGSVLASVTLSRDTRGRVYSASDLLGLAAQFRYDKNSNLTRVLDGRGNVTKVGYGPNNEPTSLTWPDLTGLLLSYDAKGRVRQAVDERSITSTYVYDNANKLTDVQFPAYSSYNLHIDYDNANRPIYVTDATGSTTINYDATRKRLTSVVTILGGRTYTVSYTYYGDGKVASMTSPVGTTSYFYNAAGRLSSMTNPFGQTTTWTYDHAGRVTGESTGTGSGTVATAYVWGVSGQAGDPSTAPAYLRTVTQTVNGQAFWTYTLKHSYLGQLLEQTGVGVGASDSAVYAYDNRGRLTSDANQYILGGNTASSNGTYQFDLSNNLQGGLNGWLYNANNQVTSAPAMGGLSGATGIGYDNAGNLTAANGLGFSYTPLGKVSTITGTGLGTVSYTYDAAGRRVSRTAGGVTTYFLYHGSSLLAELDAAGNVLKSYTWGALGLVSDRVAGASRFYLFDRGGSTRAMVSANGTLLYRGAYSAWGTAYGGYQPDTPFGWKGRWGAYRDAETGLVLMGARYYAPSIGRFISRDPAGLAAGPNVYAFCADNPVDLFDRTGLEPEAVEGSVLDGMRILAYHVFDHFYTQAMAPVMLVQGTAQDLHDTAVWAGNTMGRYDSGKASAGEAVYACGVFSTKIVGTAFTIESVGAGTVRAFGTANRVRHYTDAAGVRGIRDAGEIWTSWRGTAHEGVYVEVPPFGSARPGLFGPRARFNAQQGGFVEFTASADEITMNPSVGHNYIPASDSLPLAGRSPKFVVIRPWMFWIR